MKIDVSKLNYSKETSFSEEVTFDKEKFAFHIPLLEIKSAKVKANVSHYDDFIYISLNIDAILVLQCSYSLKPFEYKLKENDELHFATIKEDGDDDIIIYKGNFIELDEHIFDIISSSIPMSPKAPDAKLPNSGKDYRVLSDEELKKEKENSTDPRFDKLKDLEFDD